MSKGFGGESLLVDPEEDVSVVVFVASFVVVFLNSRDCGKLNYYGSTNIKIRYSVSLEE